MKLIDADKLKTELDAWARIIQNPDHYMRADALHIIDTAPEIDAVPVVRGKWRFVGCDGWNDCYECSGCGKMALSDSAYCPNCGAKMEVEP